MIHNHYTLMFGIMIASGLLSTMNVWADKVDDIRISLNDIYMILMMTGWMFFFMGIFYKELKVAVFGLSLALFNVWAIRTQFLVSPKQFALGMIPHHSMAVHMSKQLIQNYPSTLSDFAKNIISQQEKEIKILKGV